LSAECPTAVTIIREGPFEAGDVLTCTADGYIPTYTWTGTVNGVTIDPYIGSSYTLLPSDFFVVCTATVTELMCTDTPSDSVEGTAGGKCQINAMFCNSINVNGTVCKQSGLLLMLQMHILTTRM